jgi:arylsulfatase A-like enzyme
MDQRRAIVIVVDGLRASALGAYGNTWHGTPALDALASQAVVVETMWAESLELADFYRAAWTDGEFSRSIGAAAGELTFLTDDAAMAAWADATPGVETWLLESPEPSGPVDDVNETAAARLFAAAAERLQAWDHTPAAGPRVLWIHARGYRSPWDAPLELRASLLDEGDPEAPTFLQPPVLTASDDHDALLAYRVAYAAQTMVLDECLSGLLTAAEPGDGVDQVVVLAGARGFALGEHGVVGGECWQLYGEVLHLPCLMHTTGSAPAPPRRRGLATPTDLGVTILAWLGVAHVDCPTVGVDLCDESSQGRLYVASRSAAGERSLRTDEWFLRKPASAGSESDAVKVELFVKPDDRWEANDLADRCHQDAEELLALLDRAETESDQASFPAGSAADEPSRSEPGLAR